jgi:hypothetical protein
VQTLTTRFGLGLILIAAFALRLYRLGVSSLWYDETVSVFLAQQELAELTRHTAGDIHPPLYYYLLHFWGRFAGWSEFAMAFVSLFFGVLLIALVYRIAREWFDHRVAILAAFLVALSPYHLWYSQEVRMYTFGAMLGLASVYFFARLFQPSLAGNPKIVSRNFIAYAVVSALGIYTLYYFAFLLVFENLAALLWVAQSETKNRKPKIATWVSSQFAILVLYLPWLFTAIRQAIEPPVPPWRSFTWLPQVLLESFSALALGQSIEPQSATPVVILVAVVILFALKQNGQPTVVGGLFLLGYTFVPLAFIFVLSLWKPLYHVRYIFTYSPAFYILVALGFSRLAIHASRLIFYATLAILIAASTFSIYQFWFNPQYAKDDLRGAVNYIDERWRPGDAVLINAGYTYPAFVLYFDQPVAWRGRLTEFAPRDASGGAIVAQTGSLGGAPNLGWGDPRSDFYATTIDETRAALDRLFAAHPRVWMLRLYDTVVDPDGIIRDYLATHGRILDDQGFAGESFARVQGYLTTRAPIPALLATVTRREVVFGNRIALLGIEPAALTTRAGVAIDLNLYWQAIEPTNIDNRLFIGLYADDSTLVAATDEIPIGNAWGTSRWTPGEILREPIRVPLPAHLPPGNYELRAALYNPLTHEALEARGAEVSVNNYVRLMNVRVEK